MSMRNRFAVLAVFTVLCTLGFLHVPAAGAQTTTALFLDSQPGDWVGGGIPPSTWFEGQLTFTVNVASTPSRISLRVDDQPAPSSIKWNLLFVAPIGSLLTPGVYDYASGFAPTLRPGLSIDGMARGCSRSEGRFVVHEIAFDAGGALTAFAADFEQHCEDATPALFGAIRYKSSRSNLVPFDGNYPVYAMHVDSSPYGRVSGGGLDCGAGGTTCDQQYPVATPIALNATPAPGYVFLAWSADCEGKPASFTLTVSRRKRCTALFDAVPGSGFVSPFTSGNRLYIEGQPGAPWGATRWMLQSSDAPFTLNAFDAGVSVFATSYIHEFWRVEFAAPKGQALVPGVYEGAVRGIASTSMAPGIDLGGLGIGCNTARGRFVVYEYTRDSGGNVERLSVDFEFHCEGRAPAMFGAFRYNATRKTLVPFDGAYPVYLLTIDPPVNGNVTAAGINCGAGGADCNEAFSASGTVTLTATPAPGHVFVGWTGECSGSAVTTIAIVSRHVCGAVFDDVPGGPLADDLRLGSLYFFSQRGDYIGQGQRHLWTRRDTLFEIVPSPVTPVSRAVTFDVDTPDGDSWRLEFVAPAGQLLHVGDFDGAVGNWFASPLQPGLNVGGHGRGCSGTGRFRIYEVQFDNADKVTSFAADFEQHCGSVTMPALFGAIRYNSTRASVLPFDGEFLPRPDMALETPLDGSTVTPTFAVAGWALNQGDQSGTGVDAVHVYAFPLPGGAPIFLGVAAYGAPRSDLAARFGSQFLKSGFSLTTSPALPPGKYVLVAIARDTVTGTFNTFRTAMITVAMPVSVPAMAIDTPPEGAAVVGAFALNGWAIDFGAFTGSGVDAIHVYAFKSGSSTPIFLGVATLGVARPDLVPVFGPQFGTAGYHLDVSGLAPGSYTLWVGARSTVSGQFTGTLRTITVTSSTAMAIDAPADGSHFAGSFLISGWALDAAAPSGSGVDAVHVWAVPANGDAAVFLGVATLNGWRPDIGAIYGARFSNAGFNLVAAPLPPGAYTIAAIAHSAATDTFNQMKMVTVIVP